jgi:4-hydroxy-2-oxoheptanedioate aldolase
MNSLEQKMVEVLSDLRENNSVIGVKAEFEAEGTRLEEALRLKEVVTRAGLELTIKIGGCEALRDMYECRTVGVERLVAPMVESPFALKKFLQAANLAYPEDERKYVKLVVNIETKTAVEHFSDMLNMPQISDLHGIVMGRVDLTGSLGLDRDRDINGEEVFEITRNLFRESKSRGMENAVGGGVSVYSIPFFLKLADENLIDRYETRKVIFKCPDALHNHTENGIMKAVGFELLWLKNKRDYYQIISEEDAQRIQMLENRYKTIIEKAGGYVQ